MAVQTDALGRRWVQVEVEVPVSAEVVWRAIATGSGISAWFVPTTFECDDNGKPSRICSNFGPGMESVATVTDWDPPRRFNTTSADLGPDAPHVDTDWIVNPQTSASCVVGVTHAVQAETDAWDRSLESWEKGWPDFFRLLRLYLTHFADLPGAAFQLMGGSQEPTSAAWAAFTSSLGLSSVAVGDRVHVASGVPELGGTVERAAEESYAEEMILLLDQPDRGFAHLFAMAMGGSVLLSLRIHFFGENAASSVTRDKPRWQAWMSEHFPSPGR